MIIHDERDQVDMYKIVLDAGGALVHAAVSVAEAKAALMREHFHFVVTDLEMPGASGYDLVQWLQSTPGENQTTLVIAITAMVTTHDREDSLAAGFADHCTKPCSPRQLSDTIERLLMRQNETA